MARAPQQPNTTRKTVQQPTRAAAPAALAALLFCSPGLALGRGPIASDEAPTAQQPAAAAPASAPAAADTSPAAPVAPAEPASSWSHQGVLSSATWGGRGIHRTASAYPLTRGAFTLTVQADYFRANSFFLSGDSDTSSGQSIHAAYSPVQGLELALSQQSLANSYDGPVPRNLQLQGSPSLRLKYGHHVVGPLALGALAAVNLPSMEGNVGASLHATSFAATGLVSLQPSPRLEIIGNLGFVFDRSRHVFRGEVPDVVQRFAFGINATSAVRWGLGITGRISLGNVVDLLPFVEATGDVGLARAATYKTNPMQATVGLRGYPTGNRAVELALGSDVRIFGGPRPASPFGGLPPWRAFAQITVHLGEGRGAVAAISETQALAQAGQTFRIRGHAVDVDTGQPVLGASVHLVGDEALLLFGVDEQSGQFVSAPQPAGAGSLHLVARAPGYQTTELDVPRSADGRDVETVLQLRAEAGGRKMALLKGSIKDAETGGSIVGAEVVVQALKRVLHADKAGAFGALVKPGRYSVVVRAPGFESQRKVLTLRVGESMVLNVDLNPAGH